jgi:hypothetical protein
MSRKARMRAAAASAVALAIGLSLATGVIHGVWANFQSETQNSNSAFAADYVDAPSSLGVPAPDGLGAVLTWVAGTHNVSNQDIWAKDNTTTTSCTGVTYASLNSAIGATTTTIGGTTTPNDAGSNSNGDNVCYQIRSTNASGWYTVGNFADVQVGLVPNAIAFSGSGSGSMATNNTFTIGFNQHVKYTGGNVNVVATAGAVTFGAAGTLIGAISATVTKTGSCNNSTVAPTNTSTLTLTVTLKGCPNGANTIKPTKNVTGTYTGGGTTVKSTNGAVAQCTLTGQPTAGCQPRLTW